MSGLYRKGMKTVSKVDDRLPAESRAEPCVYFRGLWAGVGHRPKLSSTDNVNERVGMAYFGIVYLYHSPQRK